MSPRSVLRMLTVSGAAALAVGLTALPALAHVTVSAPGATQGGYGVLVFRVPTESDTAATTGLKVQLPAGQPLSAVRVKPKAGWTATITRAELATPVTVHGEQVTDAPSVVEWKAAAGTAGIRPEEFDEFELSVGPLPKAPGMTFKAIQTYSDGTVVSWIEEAAPGSTEEPERPAPTLALAPPAGEGTGTAGEGTGTAGDRAGTASAAYSSELRRTDDDGPGRGQVTGAYAVGGAGLLAGLAGLALALRRRTPAGAPASGPGGTSASGPAGTSAGGPASGPAGTPAGGPAGTSAGIPASGPPASGPVSGPAGGSAAGPAQGGAAPGGTAAP